MLKRTLDSTAATAAKRLNQGHGAALHCFRSDLRTHDNPSLQNASEYAGTGGRLHTIFLIQKSEWKRHELSPAKVDLILRTLTVLRSKLQSEYNIPLECIDTEEPYERTLLEYCKKNGVSSVFMNAEYEYDETQRDERVVSLLSAEGIPCTLFHDQCVVKPGLLKTKSSDKPFAWFTPFKNAWIGYLTDNPMHNGMLLIKQDAFKINVNKIPTIEQLEYPDTEASVLKVARKEWPEGEDEALERLRSFVDTLISGYKEDRDFPAINKTSRLSAYLNVGSLSVKECVSLALQVNQGRFATGSPGIVSWISELVWREFFRHVLFSFPKVSKGQPFKAVNVAWRHYKEPASAQELQDFHAWCTGHTGYPIVDAAMRCLNATGWMHNRLRMVCAMFLTKHLLIWWPRGESYFMRHLIDGDLASNNGGWQWSASTGTDPNPYFRIFNPILQSEKFDPNGDFIAKWVPELAHLKGCKGIHLPGERLSASEFSKLNYPAPIIEHKFARERCLAAFKKQ